MKIEGRYANIKVIQGRGVVAVTIDFPMVMDTELLRLVGNKLPDAESPIMLTVERSQD